MSDILVRALASQVGVRAVACITTELTRDAAERHAAYPIAVAALGHGLTAGVLLGALLKAQERVALKIEGDGRLRKVVVEADAIGHVRGYVGVPDASSPLPVNRAAVAEAIGSAGLLTVVMDLHLKNLYRSVIALESGAPDAELTRYFTASEQLPSLVTIDVLMDEAGGLVAAGGLLVQVMPGHSVGALAQVAANLAAQPPLETLLAAGLTPDELLAHAFAGIDYEVLERYPVEFRCSCSRARSEQALRTLDRDDLLTLVADGNAIVDCHFCNARYEFTEAELRAMLEA